MSLNIKEYTVGDFQWLGLHTFTAGGTGLTPDWGTKIPQVIQYNQKKKKNKAIYSWPLNNRGLGLLILHNQKIHLQFIHMVPYTWSSMYMFPSICGSAFMNLTNRKSCSISYWKNSCTSGRAVQTHVVQGSTVHHKSSRIKLSEEWEIASKWRVMEVFMKEWFWASPRKTDGIHMCRHWREDGVDDGAD